MTFADAVFYLFAAILVFAALCVITVRNPVHAALWLVLAFFLCEVRMILDCFDGVLARARGTSSPFGRALDEIAVYGKMSTGAKYLVNPAKS